MKSAKNTMLAQNTLAMSGGQGDFPWAFASLQTPYMRAALPPAKMSQNAKYAMTKFKRPTKILVFEGRYVNQARFNGNIQEQTNQLSAFCQ
jgi:hypothetical protein